MKNFFTGYKDELNLLKEELIKNIEEKNKDINDIIEEKNRDINDIIEEKNKNIDEIIQNNTLSINNLALGQDALLNHLNITKKELYDFILSQKKEVSDAVYEHVSNNNKNIYKYIDDQINLLKNDMFDGIENLNLKHERINQKIKSENDFERIKKFFYKAQESTSSKIFLFGAPEHGNLGDQAIAYAEKKFIYENFNKITYCEISWDMYNESKYYLLNNIQLNDIILIHGGGFMGSLWKNEQDNMMKVLEDFSENNIIIMPQTYWYEQNEDNEKYNEIFYKVLKKCKHIYVCLREKSSLDLFNQKFPQINTLLIPDMALLLNEKIKSKDTNDVVFIMRNDKEKVFQQYNEITTYLDRKKITYMNMSTVIEEDIPVEQKEKYLWQFFGELASARLVITDRLHGMIFATMLGIPCIAFNNISKKIEGTYEWIKELGYIKILNDINEFENIFKRLYGKQKTQYNNKIIENHYAEIKTLINNLISNAK